MPEIPVGAQIFDVVFHPTFSTVYTGLLTGYVKAFSYDAQGNHKAAFSVRPSKSSCRGLSLNQDGSHIYAVGKGKALSTIDTLTEAIDIRVGAHNSAINRVKHLMPWLLSTGDDDGTVKLWDPRQRESVQTYTQHFDYISDFLWLHDKRQLVATSGDGTLSVMDTRSKKAVPVAHSEDQEDELLSIVAIKGASKFIVGTQLGILSVFNRSSGWGDCVDRIPGHPLSVDALCALPCDLPNVDATSTILTGSSDGYVRAVQILPTKLLGVVADHGEWPVERISIGGGYGQLSIDIADPNCTKVGDKSMDEDEDEGFVADDIRRWWVGSVGHEEVLRLTDLEGFFRDNENNQDDNGTLGVDTTGDSEVSDNEEGEEINEQGNNSPEKKETIATTVPKDEDSEQESDGPQPKKRKRKLEVPMPNAKKKKGKNAVVVERSFFDEL